MKKLLISIFALGYILNLTAANPFINDLQSLDNKPLIKKDRNHLVKNLQRGTRADGEDARWFGYCNDIYTAYGFGYDFLGAVIEGIIEIPEEVAKDWKGSKVTAVNVGFGQSSYKNVNIFVTKDLEGVPASMQEAEMVNQLGWNEVTLDTPYVIDGDGFYVGYQTIQNSTSDYPIAVDGLQTDLEYGSIIGLTYNDETEYAPAGYMFGNVCLKIKVEGDNMASYGVIPEGLYMANMTAINKPFQAILGVVNTGNDITDAEVYCNVNGNVSSDLSVSILGEGSTDSSKEETTNDLIPFGTLGFIVIDGLTSDVAGNVPVEVVINTVSGPDGTTGNVDISATTTILVADKLFPRKIVMEEFTGTWCGACPAGIVGMDYMEENYPDTFIGIVAHYDDPMYTDSYWDIIYNFSGGQFPSGVMNRALSVYPSKEDLIYAFDNVDKEAVAQVELEAMYDAEYNVIQAKSISQFGFTADNVNYAVAFVLTQNNVGPYVQTNNYSGQNIDMGGWENLGPNVPTMYDHVARDIFFAWGIEESLLTEVEEDQTYEFPITLPLDNVSNVTNSDVIVLLLDATTGEIVNAAKVKMSEQAGVESLVAEPADGVYKVYNLQGIKVLETKDPAAVNGLGKGIYIVNGKKVVL